MRLVTVRSRPNPIRSKTKQNATTLLAEHSGRLLEPLGNNRPRGMTVRRQNPAYRPAAIHIIYSELTKTSTALSRLAVLFVLSAARRLVLIFVNPLYNGKADQRHGMLDF